MSSTELQDSVLGSFHYIFRRRIWILKDLPTKIEDISDEFRIRKFFNSWGIEEDGKIREFKMRTVFGGVE